MLYSSELNLERRDLQSAIYKRKQIQPSLGGSTLSLTNGNPSTTFLIQGDAVYNLARTEVDFDMVYLQTGALPANNSVNNIFTDCLPIHQIILYAGSNYPLATIEECQLYTKVAHPMSIDIGEYNSRGPVYGDTAIGTAFPISQNMGCQPVGGYFTNFTATTTTSNAQFSAQAQAVLPAGFSMTMVANAPTNPLVLNAATAQFPLNLAGNMTSTTAIAGAGSNRTTAQLLPRYPSDASIIDVVAGGDVADVASANPANQASGNDVSNRGAQQRLITSAVEAGAGESNISVRFHIPLSIFSGSILALDKDLLFGQNLQLKIIWKPIANWGFQCAGVAAGASVQLPIVTVAGVNYPLLQNMYLYMSEDVNPDTVGEFRNKLEAGPIAVNVPWIDGSQLSTGAAAGTYSIQAQLNPSDGERLKRVITAAANVANTTKRTANTFNVANVKFSGLQSKLGTQARQENVITVADSQLWNQMRDLIKRSPAGMSSRSFEENMFFVDNFSDCQDSTHFKDNDLLTSGYKPKNQTLYSVTYNQTSTGGLLLVQWRIWQKILLIEKGRLYWAEQEPKAVNAAV